MTKYKRTLEDLSSHAILSWPQDLSEKAALQSILPLLLETQDVFISILVAANSTPDAWVKAIELSSISGNLFLKHLMVLSDVSGESLSNISPLGKHFGEGKMTYIWESKTHVYKFSDSFSSAILSNSRLKVDNKSLSRKISLSILMKDVAMFIMHCASSIEDSTHESLKNQCIIGGFIGKKQELENFVRQNYIRVSRQVNGDKANAYGQLAQQEVLAILKSKLSGWSVTSNQGIPGVSHNNGKSDATFDVLVVSPTKKYFGVEVSFQATTNSTIERKAGQAKSRYDSVHATNNHICYVLDGAGWLNKRKAAARTICTFSDCTVAFTTKEICFLADFMIEMENK